MGAWKYCPVCDQPMVAPTVKECMLSGHTTCQGCGTEQHINHFEKEQVLGDFVERFESMEVSVKVLKGKVKRLKKS